VQETPFLDIQDRVTAEGGEQGLLSLAFHPDFQQNGTFYVYYTQIDNDTILERYQVSPDNPDVADPDSGVELLTIPQISTHYNGGTVLFGPDGYLYLSIGSGGDKKEGAAAATQDLTNYLGTIIRLDVNDPSLPYQIPEDNPFVNDPEALPEIWAYGLRNPWRMSFDVETGALYITDVGGSEREEVNYQPPGASGGVNYGWPWFEGNLKREMAGAESINADDFVFPVTDYDHLALGGCSIIGGDVYRGKALPQLQGKYLYGDFCTSFVWALEIKEDGSGDVETVLRDQTVQLASLATDGAGEMYLIDIGGGRMLKLVEE